MNRGEVFELSLFHTSIGATDRTGLPISHEIHTTEMDDEIVLGGGILTTLQHNPFNCNVMPTNQQEASSSHAQTFTGDGPVSLQSIITLREIIVKSCALLLSNYENHENAAIVKQYYFKVKQQFCCKGGKIRLREIPVPRELYKLFVDDSVEAKIFRKDIQSYNNVFSFTSMGVKLHTGITAGRGVYTFRAPGAIYRRIGTLLPAPGIRPRYTQIFIYDIEHEIENRLLENDRLSRELIEKIRLILDNRNPFPLVYLGVMIIKEYSGFYDPLQYPLFLSFDTYGWGADTLILDNGEVTCCDYYDYMLQVCPNNPSILLYGGRLFQQYVVDNFVKIEAQKLRYFRFNQGKIRAYLYQGLQDSFKGGKLMQVSQQNSKSI